MWSQCIRRIAVIATLALASPALAQDDDAALSAIVAAWLAAPHGDYRSPAFTYWNAEGEVPTSCAACHSQPGFIDYLGADGSAAGAVDAPAAINAPIGCASCHTTAAHELDAVTFPSGASVTALGEAAVCTACHQGRASSDTVAARVEGLDEDAVVSELGFINVHYAVAAATLHGAHVRGGYQYAGRDYVGRFPHVPSASNCTSCHDPHTTRVATETCLSCHRGVDEITAIRTRHGDFDGDGNTAEGIHGEIETLRARLGEAIVRYAAEVTERPIGYAADTFPYFFADSDGNGDISPDEAVFPNRYQSWTPRLLKAAYNYQFAKKDPGAYVHNPGYVLQLLHDSLASLAQRIEVEVPSIRRQ
ncbi:cytochrome c3 family protein [Billgrantia lactosivorans]|uniref:cytochrome c3 family protein n=1 Tax=Billgrantia lactosivorans TaxID=2185141 RepID=UPI001C555E7E|nr:cytochrome c3 family protein [Halomonas lactosivorans]